MTGTASPNSLSGGCMIYVGLALHKRYVTACAIDALGQLVAEHRRPVTDLDALSLWLGRLSSPVTVVLEATLYWAWLEQQLTALGYTVQVAHPDQVKLIWQARTKTDPIDARQLAERARVQLLPAIWIPDPATRAQRQLLRGRAFLVRQRTVLKNRIHAYLTAEHLRAPATDLYGRAGRAGLATLSLPPVVRRYVDLLLGNLDLLSTQIVALDKYLQRHVRHDPVAQRLETIPGVGAFGALLLQAEIGPIARFSSAQELAAYAGLVPSTHSSGGKTHHGHVGCGTPGSSGS